jgi:hypothetical protein
LSRQNFSCAHEIGHILLDTLNISSYLQPIEYRTFDPDKRRKEIINKKEALCDIVASELLMPECVFGKYLENNNVSIMTLENMAKQFNTSIQATARRMVEISSQICIAIFWKQKIITSKTLYLAWKEGPGRKYLRPKEYYVVDEIAQADSIIGRTFQGNQISICYKLFKTGIDFKRFKIESKAYGSNKDRFVLSLASTIKK